MRPQHEETIQRLIAHFQNDPRYPALIVGGSVAKGWANDDSDVDILLVATDEEYAASVASGEVGYFNRELAEYPGGYIDGKIINVAYLEEVADHGSEPARAAFLGALIAYSRIPSLNDLVQKITVYPEHERAAKMRAFASHLTLLHWYMGEAEKRNDPYLLSWAANNLVLYGGRLILAHNRLFFPYHKWLLRQVSLAPEKPTDMLALAEAVLKRPSKETALRYYTSVNTFRDWGVDLHHAGAEFILQTEWNWRDGRPPLPDW
jgi:predicted nucleotidyltransferase